LYAEPGGEARQLDMLLEQLAQSRNTLHRQREDIELQLKEYDDIEARCRSRLADLRPQSKSKTN